MRCRFSRRATGVAHTTSPADAATDIANPTSAAISGHQVTEAITAVHRAGSACERRDTANASSPTPPINAARTTLGDGRTMIANATMTTRPTAVVHRGPAPANRTNRMAAPVTSAKFAPLIASRWANPVTRNCSVVCALIADVSPSTSPGSKSPAPPGSIREAEVENRWRTASAALRCHGAGRSRWGGDTTDNVATVMSSPGGARTVAKALTRWPGCSEPHSCATRPDAYTTTRAVGMLCIPRPGAAAAATSAGIRTTAAARPDHFGSSATVTITPAR